MVSCDYVCILTFQLRNRKRILYAEFGCIIFSITGWPIWRWRLVDCGEKAEHWPWKVFESGGSKSFIPYLTLLAAKCPRIPRSPSPKTVGTIIIIISPVIKVVCCKELMVKTLQASSRVENGKDLSHTQPIRGACRHKFLCGVLGKPPVENELGAF